MISHRKSAGLAVGLLASTLLAAGGAQAAVLDSVSVFATAPAGTSGPDSVTIGDNSVFIGYTGGTSGRGTGISTIQQYSLSGVAEHSYTLPGNVDGLKVNPTTGILYALQNQDSNSTLTLIDPVANTVSAPLSYASPPYVYGTGSTHGYDDVAFRNGQVFLSATNPKAGTDPILALLDQGNAPSGTLTTTTVLTAGQVSAPLPDADSLKLKPNGDLVQTDGNGGRYVTISNPGTASQTATPLQLTINGANVTSLDDVLFPSASSGTLFVADGTNNRILELQVSGLDPNTPFVSLDNANQLVTVDASGATTPFFIGNAALGSIGSPHGLDFLPSAASPVPEPGSLALVGAALVGLLGFARRRT